MPHKAKGGEECDTRLNGRNVTHSSSSANGAHRSAVNAHPKDDLRALAWGNTSDLLRMRTAYTVESKRWGNVSEYNVLGVKSLFAKSIFTSRCAFGFDLTYNAVEIKIGNETTI